MIHGVKILGETEEIFHVCKIAAEMAAFFVLIMSNVPLHLQKGHRRISITKVEMEKE